MEPQRESESAKFADLMCQCCGRLCRVMNGVLAKTGVNMSQCQAMSVLSNSGTMRMSDLAKQLGVTMSAATNLADRLLEAGIAEREHDPDDRRLVKLRLTEEGTKALERDRANLAEFWTGVFDRVSSEERQAFFDVYEEVLRLAEKT